MELIDRTFKTVAKPEGSSTFRTGSVTVVTRSYSKKEAPIAVILGETNYRVIDGRLHIPLPHIGWHTLSTESNQQLMINKMLLPELSNEGYRDLRWRMGRESQIDLTETPRGQLIRDRALAYPLVDGVQYIPVPGPLVDIRVIAGESRHRDVKGEPMPEPGKVTVSWKEYDQAGLYGAGAIFTIEDVDKALTFAASLEGLDISQIPSAESLLEKVSDILPYEPASIEAMQVWIMACNALHTATYTGIHDLGRQGVLAMLALRRDLSSRMGVEDAFLDRHLLFSSEREHATYLRALSTTNLEDTLGPVLGTLTARENGQTRVQKQIEQKLLSLLRPSYTLEETSILDNDELAALEAASLMNNVMKS